MKLFRVSLKSIYDNDKKIRNLYVIEHNKESAIKYVVSVKDSRFEVTKVCYLGFELSGRMFKGGAE